MAITIKCVPKQHVFELETILLVAKVPGCGSDIVHLLLYWEMIKTFRLRMDQSPEWFLDLRFACSFHPPEIEYGGLPIPPAWLSVSTAEIICCNIFNLPCTLFASFAFDVVISLIYNDFYCHHIWPCEIFYTVIFLLWSLFSMPEECSKYIFICHNYWCIGQLKVDRCIVCLE